MLQVREDVAFVDELVLFGDFLHHSHNQLLGVRRSPHAGAELRAHLACTAKETCRRTASTLTGYDGSSVEIPVCEDSLLTDGVGDKDLEEVVCDIVHLVNLLDVGSDDRLLVVEHSDRAVHLYVHVLAAMGQFKSGCLLVVEVLERNWGLIFTLLVKNDLQCASVVIDGKQGPHWFECPVDYTAHQDDL